MKRRREAARRLGAGILAMALTITMIVPGGTVRAEEHYEGEQEEMVTWNYSRMGYLLQGRAVSQSGKPIAGIEFTFQVDETEKYPQTEWAKGLIVPGYDYCEPEDSINYWADHGFEASGGWVESGYYLTDNAGYAPMTWNIPAEEDYYEADYHQLFLTVRPWESGCYTNTWHYDSEYEEYVENQSQSYWKWMGEEEIGLSVLDRTGEKIGHVTLKAEVKDNLKTGKRQNRIGKEDYTVSFEVDEAAEDWSFSMALSGKTRDDFAYTPGGKKMGDLIAYSLEQEKEYTTITEYASYPYVGYDGLCTVTATYAGEIQNVVPDVVDENSAYVERLPENDTVLTAQEMSDLAKKNEEEPVIIKVSDQVSFTFPQGTMSLIEGKESYDFGVTVNTNEDEVAEHMKAYTDRTGFVSEFAFNYEGILPGSPTVQIAMPQEYIGRTLAYYQITSDEKLEFVELTKVDENGFMRVKMDHCSDYAVMDMGLSSVEETSGEEDPGNPGESGQNTQTPSPSPTVAPATVTSPDSGSAASTTPVAGAGQTSADKTETTASTDQTAKKPAKVKNLQAKNKKGRKLALTWKKVSGAKGYQVQYAQNKKWKSAKNKSVKAAKLTLKKCKKGKTYYIRVRAWKKQGSTKVFGKWSAVKKIKITK